MLLINEQKYNHRSGLKPYPSRFLYYLKPKKKPLDYDEPIFHFMKQTIEKGF